MDGLTQADLAFIASSGRNPDQVAHQLEMLRGKWKSVSVVRAAKPGDGIRSLSQYDHNELNALQQEAATAGRLSSFIPASGSGTRLFQSLLSLHRENETELERIRWRADRGDAVAKDALPVLDNISRFAIWPSLEIRGCSSSSISEIFRELFSDGGLRYHERPKALIPFHRYSTCVRTAFAEHLREAAVIGTTGKRECRVHFTVSPEHRQAFEEAWRLEKRTVEQQLSVRFDVSFSVQAHSTDTIAVDSSGNLLRDKLGHIAFRPGGHGALLPNLRQTGGDLLAIKNIDNVAREENHASIGSVRRLICGLLLRFESEVHQHIRALRLGGNPTGALDYLAGAFGLNPPAGASTKDQLVSYVNEQLNRPIRVCGVVGTLDHAGGRPFWVETDDRGITLQLVEGAEVNLDDVHERRIFRQSRHFNPVDMACSIRDADGRPFDLAQFSIPGRALIARKVVAGTPSLIYEHPGLWNGSMGLWNTVFVEVPGATFNPVKSLADLWTPGHKPAQS